MIYCFVSVRLCILVSFVLWVILNTFRSVGLSLRMIGGVMSRTTLMFDWC